MKPHKARELLNSTDPPYTLGAQSGSESPREYFDIVDAQRDLCLLLDGAEMRDQDELSKTIRSRLQLYDHNLSDWLFMEEALQDLNYRMPFSKLLLVVTNGDQVLIRAPHLFEPFRNILDATGKYWAAPIRSGNVWDHEAVPFHTVFVFPKRMHGARGLDLIR